MERANDKIKTFFAIKKLFIYNLDWAELFPISQIYAIEIKHTHIFIRPDPYNFCTIASDYVVEAVCMYLTWIRLEFVSCYCTNSPVLQ